MKWSEPHLPADGGPPTIKNHSVTYHNGLLYCFGGYDGRRNHMTLLVYSLRDQRWTPVSAGVGNGGGGGGGAHTNASISGMDGSGGDRRGGRGGRGGHPHVTVAGTPPPGRNGHTATLATSRRHGADGREGENNDREDDDDSARIFVIGGWLGSGPLAASDMHVLDISGGVEGLRWYQPPVRGTPPGPCNMHSADFVPTRNEVYVFRGGNGREYLNDLHALDVNTYTWRAVETTGAAPQQRANHSSAVLEELEELFIFGGWNGKERLNDIHILHTGTGAWTCPRIGGVLPHPRAGMTLTALRGRLYLFGGSGTSSKCFQDLQILDRKEMAWLDVMQQDETSSNMSTWHMHEHHSDNEDYPRGNRRQGDRRSASARQTHEEMDDGPSSSSAMSIGGGGGFRKHADWRTQEIDQHDTLSVAAQPCNANPNDEDTIPTVFVQGGGPGRRAGHTATAVHRHIYVFGGSCGSDYLNDFFVLDTDPPPRIAVTEPTSLQLFERRLRHFFNDEEFSDVTFIVEGQHVYGHRMILSLVSDCFRAMFTTGFRESAAGCPEIEIPNCSHEAFLAMMEYIYTGKTPKIELFGVESGRGIDKVVDLLELADQFFLDHLKQICERMLQSAVNADTVEYLLQVSQKTNAVQLESVCRHYERNRESIGG
eukprot:CAMPEP_0185731426 /NCGR_PEP_ID=MMETSP1171-20130828/12877_1 /TAXON_ID=374046 /ORGANISM="Helicotheca tamensis, Strain CCMP826" /LENGTH=653 /DNA_ID=CAMNT_0028400689 /DNA_START=30 /DNA_END=1991 /DNA_ORIENTATION=-